jgi:hypothetical protein
VLFESGKVLFGDPITDYVKSILFKVAGETLASTISVFTLKSAGSDLFMIDDGVLFITTGLLAQLENEAQLAYLLAQRISHYTLNHKNQIDVNREIKNSTYYGFDDYDEILLRYSSYSELQEKNADRKGIELYLKTDYALGSILTVFDVLNYSYLPFSTANFDFRILEDSSYVLPNKWQLDASAKIDYLSKNKDFHTSTVERQRNNKVYLTELELLLSEGKEFVVSKEEFSLITARCRFETIKINLLEANYSRAIYHIFLMKKEFPKNRFLNYSLAKAFYGLYKGKKFLESIKDMNSSILQGFGLNSEGNVAYDRMSRYNAELEEIIFGDYALLQGNEQSLLYAILEMSQEELNIFALKFILDFEKQHGQCWSSVKYKSDIIFDLQMNHEREFTDFSDVAMKKREIFEQGLARADTIDITTLSKVDKIKFEQEQKLKRRMIDADFRFHLLVEYVKDEDLINLFDNIKAKVEVAKEKNKKWTQGINNPKTMKRVDKWEKKYGDYLAVDSILVLQPFYLNRIATTRSMSNSSTLPIKYRSIDYEKSDIRRNDYLDLITENMNIVDLHGVIFSVSELNKEVAIYNENAILNEFLREKVNTSVFDMIPLNLEYCHPIIEKYGTSKLYYSGMVGDRIKKVGLIKIVGFSLLFPPSIPFTAFGISTSLNKSFQYDLVLDIENGKVCAANATFFKHQYDSYRFVDSQVYETVYKIKHHPRKSHPLSKYLQYE